MTDPTTVCRTELERLRSEFFTSALILASAAVVGYVSFTPNAGASDSHSTGSTFVSVDFVTLSLNNTAVFAALLLGGFLFGGVTIFLLANTGFVTGLVTAASLHEGTSVLGFVALVLPHGIIEFPAYFLGGAIGFKITRSVVQYLRGKRDRPLTSAMVQAYTWLAALGLVAIVVSAFIEAEITPIVYEMVTS